MRRPPSLSESYIYTAEYNFINEPLQLPSINTLVVREVDNNLVNKKKDDRCEIITEYLLRFLMHLSLISFFETVFFFHFVSIDEDKGIISTAAFYTNKLIDSCENLSSSEITIVDFILERFINASAIVKKGHYVETERMGFNYKLNILSWAYFAVLTAFLVGVGVFSYFKKYKIKWLYIIGENLVFVSMLGVYEFMFFETIVKKYSTLSPEEISGGLVLSLQQSCNLLT